MTPQTPRSSLASVSTRVDVQDRRLDDLEARLAKYDVIIAKLDTLIDVLSRRVETVADKAEDAIEDQKLLHERNESAYRWSAVWIALATSLVAGVLCFVVGYVLH